MWLIVVAQLYALGGVMSLLFRGVDGGMGKVVAVYFLWPLVLISLCMRWAHD